MRTHFLLLNLFNVTLFGISLIVAEHKIMQLENKLFHACMNYTNDTNTYNDCMEDK
jgi:hypothetical protein